MKSSVVLVWSSTSPSMPPSAFSPVLQQIPSGLRDGRVCQVRSEQISNCSHSYRPVGSSFNVRGAADQVNTPGRSVWASRDGKVWTRSRYLSFDISASPDSKHSQAETQDAFHCIHQRSEETASRIIRRILRPNVYTACSQSGYSYSQSVRDVIVRENEVALLGVVVSHF